MVFVKLLRVQQGCKQLVRSRGVVTVPLERGDEGALLGNVLQSSRDLRLRFVKVLSERLRIHAQTYHEPGIGGGSNTAKPMAERHSPRKKARI
jgi:hypothetical protein